MAESKDIRAEVHRTVTGDGDYTFSDIFQPMLDDLGSVAKIAETIKDAHVNHGLPLATVSLEEIEAALVFWQAQDTPVVSLVPAVHQV
jgi:hypothetical protein